MIEKAAGARGLFLDKDSVSGAKNRCLTLSIRPLLKPLKKNQGQIMSMDMFCCVCLFYKFGVHFILNRRIPKKRAPIGANNRNVENHLFALYKRNNRNNRKVENKQPPPICNI